MSDLISRQAAIDALGERPAVWAGSDYEIAERNQWDSDKLAIETVPSADVRENVRGEWIPTEGHMVPIYRCNKCNTLSLGGNFCSNCGADMRRQDGEQ